MSAPFRDAFGRKLPPLKPITAKVIVPFTVGFAQSCTTEEYDAALIAKYGQCPTCDDPPSVCVCDITAASRNASRAFDGAGV